jgi:endonuclease YncB( thermonuclease family)
LRLREMVVRLQGVAAPPRGLSCHAADGSASDCGAEAATALAALVRDHDVACRLHGRDSAGLAQGVCEAAGTELNRTVVAEGWARALDASGMADAETAARAARLGLWRNGPVPGF